MDWETVGFVKASNVRERILRAVSAKPSAPKDLTKNLGLNFSQVSHGLHDLMERGLVECLTEDRRKGKIYSATREGRSVTDRL
ncbi:MAG: winged helix-turn-helix domain-containing protein [Thermoplasmata archaeon]